MEQRHKTELQDVEKEHHKCCDHDHDHHHHHDHSHDHHQYNSLQNMLNWNSPKVGRNDPCVCGSGKKYKKCCIS